MVRLGSYLERPQGISYLESEGGRGVIMVRLGPYQERLQGISYLEREREREIGQVRFGKIRLGLCVCHTKNPGQCWAHQLVLIKVEFNNEVLFE